MSLTHQKRLYDLKGSLVGRQASEKDRANGGVLKDLDLMNDHQKLHLGSKKTAFMTQLKRDAMFLAQLNIMDYSLLVGIHDRDQRKASGLGYVVSPCYTILMNISLLSMLCNSASV